MKENDRMNTASESSPETRQETRQLIAQKIAPASKTLVGTSREGRPIEAFLFQSGVQTPLFETDLEVLYLGVFHGDEGIAGQLMERFIAFLTETLPEFTAEQAFAVVPVVNPDGLVQNTRFNANGVDLNRNFPTADWREENTGTPYYSGPNAGSEPETQAIIRLLEHCKPSKIVTVHSPYRVLNYDGPGRPLAEAMAAYSGYAIVESIGYPTPGSFGTYTGKERNIPTITLELPEDEPFETVWKDNRSALLAAITA